MRKYLQLIVVLAIFFSVVLIRHLREPARQPFPRGGSAIHASASLSPSPQPTATQAAAPAEIPPTPQPTPTVATALVVSVTPTTTAPAIEATPTPTAMAPAIEVTPTPTAAPNPTPTPALTKWPYLFEGSVFMDGAFTGKPDRTSYGQLQVTVVMNSGRIEDVLIVEFPDRTPTSENMSARTLPGLTAEAIARQDWDVDIVSGATQTSVAFRRAMVYALRQAEQG